MNKIIIQGQRNTGRTSILIDIAKRSLKNGLKVLFVTLLHDQAKQLIRNQKWFKNPNIEVTNQNFLKCSNFDVLLLDNVDFMDKECVNHIYSMIKDSSIIYETKLKGDDK